MQRQILKVLKNFQFFLYSVIFCRSVNIQALLKLAKLRKRVKYIWKNRDKKFRDKTNTLSVTECLFRNGTNPALQR
jgi:hypothetical protein